MGLNTILDILWAGVFPSWMCHLRCSWLSCVVTGSSYALFLKRGMVLKLLRADAILPRQAAHLHPIGKIGKTAVQQTIHLWGFQSVFVHLCMCGVEEEVHWWRTPGGWVQCVKGQCGFGPVAAVRWAPGRKSLCSVTHRGQLGLWAASRPPSPPLHCKYLAQAPCGQTRSRHVHGSVKAPVWCWGRTGGTDKGTRMTKEGRGWDCRATNGGRWSNSGCKLWISPGKRWHRTRAHSFRMRHQLSILQRPSQQRRATIQPCYSGGRTAKAATC